MSEVKNISRSLLQLKRNNLGRKKKETVLTKLNKAVDRRKLLVQSHPAATDFISCFGITQNVRIKKTRRTVKFKTSKTKETSNCLTDWQNQKDLLKMSSILRSRTSEFTAAVLRLFVQLCIQPHNLAGLTLIFQHAIDYYDSKPIVDFDRTTSVLERTSLVFNTKDFHSTKRDSILAVSSFLDIDCNFSL